MISFISRRIYWDCFSITPSIFLLHMSKSNSRDMKFLKEIPFEKN